MPDWTYHPLRPLANAVLGERRTQRVALRLLAALNAVPRGNDVIARVFDHPEVPQQWRGRLGVAVPLSVARDAVLALPTQGATVIEVGPVGRADVDRLRSLCRNRAHVVARVADPADVDTVKPFVDEVVCGAQPERHYLRTLSIPAALEALAEPGATVLATPEVLLAAGPSWFNRVIEAGTATVPAPGLRDVPMNPLRWPAWFWGVLLGLGMIVAGLGAAAITLGPVVLWYDEEYLGMNVAALHRVNPDLVHFLQHDRITMAGTMIGIGILYFGLSWGGIRRGRRWARDCLLLSGWIAFPTLLYFLVFGFVEPLHILVTVVLFPMFIFATWRRPRVPRWVRHPVVEGPARTRAVTGQLVMIVTGAGVFVAGIVISAVGLSDVFVATDLQFLGTDHAALTASNPRLLSFIAHDRAGFGGALIGAALAVVLTGMWGWREGESWVWWMLLLSATAGFGPALVVHVLIHYTSFVHLLPLYTGIAGTVAALVLSWRFMAKPLTIRFV